MVSFVVPSYALNTYLLFKTEFRIPAVQDNELKTSPHQGTSPAAKEYDFGLAGNERIGLEYCNFPLRHRLSAVIITGKVAWLEVEESKPVTDQKNIFQNNGSEMLMRLTSTEGMTLLGNIDIG